MNTQLSSKEAARTVKEEGEGDTLTPFDSFLDFPLYLDSQPQFSYSQGHCPERERQLLEEASYLREQNLFLREQLQQMKTSYSQLQKGQQRVQLGVPAEDVNRQLEDNRLLQQQNQRLLGERTVLRRELGECEVSLREIGRSNEEYYRRVVSLSNELDRQRRDYRTGLREAECRLEKEIEVERVKVSTLMEELVSEREESQLLRAILDESNRQIAKLSSLKDDLQQQCEGLLEQREDLQECMNSLNGEGLQQQLHEIRSAIEEKRAENEQLKAQLQNFEEDYRSLIQECAHFKQLYQRQLLLHEEDQQNMFSLQEQITSLKQELQKGKQVNSIPVVHHHHSPLTNKIIRRMQNADQSLTCSPSTTNKIKVLCNETTRRTIMAELKRIISQVGRVELENRIISLLHELYMDAEYRERTNLQMQEIIVQLEAKITQLQRHKPDTVRKQEAKHGHGDQYLVQLEESLSRYERLLLNADNQRLQCIDEISALKKENYQVRLQLANSQLDSETEQLIEQLTLQLQQQKRNGRVLEEENGQFRQEIVAIERQLLEKNKRIKLLMLNLNKREELRG